MSLLDRLVPASALRWHELDGGVRSRFHPWPYGIGPIGPLFARGENWREWFVRVGPAMIAVRDHRRHPPLFSERYRRKPHAWYWHIGPYCLHAKWEPLPTFATGGPIPRPYVAPGFADRLHDLERKIAQCYPGTCATCGLRWIWPDAFPHPESAECNRCAEEDRP